MKMKHIKEFLPNIKLHGRTIYDEESEALFFNWTSAGIEFTFCGTSLQAEFVAEPGTEIEGLPWDESAPRRETWPWVAVFMDGEKEPADKFEIGRKKQIKTILASDKEEKHMIRIVKLTENYKTFAGIMGFYMDGDILDKEWGKRPAIEFIGDSITCGFGNEAQEKDRLFFSEDENGWMSYGSIAARMMDMDWNMISMSGICTEVRTGMPMDYGMKDLYLYTDRIWQEKVKKETKLSKWDFKANPKDYVVINLGTNDATGIILTEDQDSELRNFCKGYKEFLKMVRVCNGPDTHIICALGSMDYYLYYDIVKIIEEYKEETKDGKISCLRLKKMSALDPIGACGHPNVVTHKKMAVELVEEIKRQMNHWLLAEK